MVSRIRQRVLVLGAIALALGYWWITFDGCSMFGRCW